MNLSKYVLVTDSIDNKFKLLYNKKNGFFIRYDKDIFPSLEDFYGDSDVESFLSDKLFFESDNEFSYIQENKNKSIKSDGFMQLIIKVTKDCNLRCSYCYENFSDKNMSKDDADKIIKFIKSYVVDNDIKTLSIGWFGGEPTLNIEIIRYITDNIRDFLDEHEVQYIPTIVTNGYNLDNVVFNELINLGIRQFQITVDGDKELHDKTRLTKNGNGSFDIIINNLKKLKNTSEKFSLTLRMNVNKNFFDRLDKVKKDVFDKFKNDERFKIDIHKIVDFEGDKVNKIDREIAELMLELTKEGYNIVDQRVNLNTYGALCYAQKNNCFVINSDCKVSKCTVCNFDYSYIGYIDINGELKYNDNINVWESLNKIECRNCTSYPICFGASCPLKAIRKNNKCCKSFIGDEETLLKILNEQGKFNMTIGGKYV